MFQTANRLLCQAGLALYMVDDGVVFVVGKKLLDAPRTIAPNETVTFSYVVEFN